jgi:hypothetical protein
MACGKDLAREGAGFSKVVVYVITFNFGIKVLLIHKRL